MDTAPQGISQEFMTKIAPRSAVQGATPEAAKGKDFGPLPGRQVEPLTLPPMATSSQPPAESATVACVAPRFVFQDEVKPVLALPAFVMETVPSPTADGGATSICEPPAWETREVEAIAPSPVPGHGVAETPAYPMPMASEAVEFAPHHVTYDDAMSPQTSPVEAAAKRVEVGVSLLTEDNASDTWTPQAVEEAIGEISESLMGMGAEGAPPAPTLLAFYGLSQQPFDVTPDPAYLYFSRVHREALTALSQGIENLRGFITLVAEPGMGKTTLLNKVMEELSGSARVVFLFQTQCSSSELLRYLLTELGVEHDGTDVVSMHRALSQVLFEEMLLGRRFVLIVDEAQNLQDSVLETIRLLSDYETTHSKLIQIVLAGQPQLVETLMKPNLSQLRQRIAVLANLEPLGATETAEYIQHRLRASGSSGESIFTPDALALIAEQSKGIPRSINNICFNAMLAGYLERLKIIDSKIVRRVAAKLDLELLIRRPSQDLANISPSAPAGSDGSAQPAGTPSNSPAGKNLPDAGLVTQAKPKPDLSLTGKLTEKLPSKSWSGENEFRIQVSLAREYSPGVPIADHYYCRSFYVSEEQAKDLHPGKPVQIKFEQD